MVTRKTRVLSAFAAVLMLVSLFTCFVLPASAVAADYEMPEAPANLKAYKNRTASDGLTDYAINDIDDWFAAVKDSNGQKGPLNTSTEQSFEGITLWITNDLDFGGTTRTVDSQKTLFFNWYASSSAGAVFKGTIQGQGHTIKGLVVDMTVAWITNGNYSRTGLVCSGANATIRDLTVDSSCSFKYDCSGYNTGDKKTMEFFSGVFMGYGSACTLINCRNEASLEFTNSTVGNPKNTGNYKAQVSSIAMFGRQYGGATIINCSNSGTFTNNNTGRSSALAEWMNKYKAKIYNSYNTGAMITNYTGTEDRAGLFSTADLGTNGPGTYLDLANLYNVGDNVASGVNSAAYINSNGEAIEAEIEATGELAHKLNVNYKENDYGRVYFTTKDGKAVIGKRNNATVKVVLNFYGVEYATYTNVGKALELDELHQEIIDGYEVVAEDSELASVTDGVLTVSNVPSDFVINVDMVAAGLQLQGLKDKVAEIKADGPENYSGDSYDGTLEEFLAELDAKIADSESDPMGPKAYADNAAIQNDLAMLEEYVLNDILPANLIAKYPDKVAYTVSNKAEMDALAESYEALTPDQTIYITADIDMQGSKDAPNAAMPGLMASIDGRNHTIENYYLNGALLGIYLGKEVKDLTFKNSIATTDANDGAFLINNVTTGTTTKLSNLTMDGVVSKSTFADGGRQGLIVSQLGGGTLTFEDIVVVNSTMTRGDGTEYLNSGLVLGKTYGGKLIADGLYLDNNTINGNRPSGTGRGVVMGEVLCTAEVKNVLVKNTHVAEGQVSGIFGVIKEHGSNYVVDPVMTYENIISYNNGYTGCFTRPNTSDGSTITFKNIYTDATAFLSSEDYNGYVVEDSCILSAGEAIASGEAAWALNAALAGDKWTMVDGEPAFGTEDDQTVRVAIEMADFETEYAYVNLDDETTLVHTVPTATFALKNAADSAFAAVNGDKLTFTGIPTENLTVVITAVSGELYFDALDAKIAEIGDKAAFYLDAEGTKTVEADLTAIKERRAANYNGLTQKNIQDDLALLNSYVLTEVDAEAEATLEAAKAELEAFGEHISYFVQAELMLETLADIKNALNYEAPANAFEALQITAAINTAIENYNAIGERTIAEGKIVPLKLYDLFKAYTKNWTVADEQDWRAGTTGITTNGESEGMTITMIADVDMAADGDDSAVLPLAYTKYFNGTFDGQGHVFKNLKMDVTVTEGAEGQVWVGLIGALGKSALVKNVGIESGFIVVTSGVSHAARVGSVVGYGGSGSVIQNCWNAASVTYKLLEGGRADSYTGGVVGSGIGHSTVDGCYNVGAVYSEGSHAAGINGWAQGGSSYTHGRVYNSFNAGTVTCVKNPTYVGAIRTGGTAVNGVTNSYAIGNRLVYVADTDQKIAENPNYQAAIAQNNDSNSNLPYEIYTTGELAWKLNSGFVENYSNHTDPAFAEGIVNYPQLAEYEDLYTYYTVKDGKTVFGTEENQTIRVTIKHDGIENVIYVNADEYYDLGATGTYVLESGAAEVVDGRYLKIDSPEDIVVTVSVPEGVPGNHSHAEHMNYVNNQDGTHTPECGYTVLIDGRRFNCDYVGETTACTEFTYAVDQASIDADTHAHQSVATCTACGYNAPAADCAAGFTEEETATPDCVTPGEMTFTCKNNCGYSYTERISENGHKEVYTPAGNNQHTVTCENCDVLNEIDDCTPNENTWNETFAPSVNEFGTKETTCTVCGGKVTAQIAKLTAAMITAGINAEETEVTGTVELLNNPGVDSVTVKVAFDYTIMDLKNVAAENGLAVGTPTVEDGVVTFTVTGEIDGDINIAIVTFTMKTEQDGSLVASNRDYELKATADEMEGSKDIFTVTKGKDIVKGDMTGDKEVDLSDAILLIRYISGTDLPEGYVGTITDSMADLTDEGDGVDLGDGQVTGEVNVNDVLYLLRYLNGWTNVL